MSVAGEGSGSRRKGAFGVGGDDGGRHRRGDAAGFTLLVVLVAITVISILLSAAVTTWTHVTRRADEAELIWRGEQYAKAIECYVGLRATPPVELQQLVDARCLRKLYRQPLSPDGSWQIVRATLPGAPSSPESEDEESFGLRRNMRSSQPIIGVAPGITGTAIRAYEESLDYAEWEFVFGDDDRPPVRALGLPEGFEPGQSLDDILRRQRGGGRSR